ncbi:DUF3459 domain-containing protein [Oxalobacteraceae bacterium]|nr:DUF3459 domain-containing protein [Oxalobacteraceae bacterium]
MMTARPRSELRQMLQLCQDTLPQQCADGVRFRYEGAAERVAIAGTFNSWVGDSLPLTRIGPGCWECVLALEPGRHHYKYVIDGSDWIVDPANPWISEDAQNNSALTVSESGAVFIRQGQVSAADPSDLYARYPTLASPDWLADAVVYQLSVRAFGGSFASVRERLPYLAELGINTVWLMPLQPIGVQGRSGSVGDPYAVRDFMAIDPQLGDAQELRALIADLHARGMRVLLDWPLNRASVDNVLTQSHPHWFTRDAQGQVCYAVPNRSYFAGFDFANAELRAWLTGALAHWLREFDLDGFRFDDADIVPRDFLEALRAALLRQRPALALISHSCDEYHHLAACDLSYDGALRHLAGQVAQGRLPAAAVAQYWEESTYSFPRGALRLRWLEEKEQGRAWRALGLGLHQAAATLLLTLDGVPHLLMGQEFNEPGWQDWRSLFDDFRLDWHDAHVPTLGHYRNLLGMRAQYGALRRGSVVFVAPHSPDWLAYWRALGSERILVVINLSPQPVTLPEGLLPDHVLYAQGLSGVHRGAPALAGFGCVLALA